MDLLIKSRMLGAAHKPPRHAAQPRDLDSARNVVATRRLFIEVYCPDVYTIRGYVGPWKTLLRPLAISRSQTGSFNSFQL